VDVAAFHNAGVVINLTGANIGAKRWTTSYKKEIYSSRVESTAYLCTCINKWGASVHTYIQASGIGAYDFSLNLKEYTEDAPIANNFMAKLCEDWENANAVLPSSIKIINLRTAVVFNPGSEAYEKISTPIKYGFGAALGSGKQIFSWIHLYDLCRVYEACIFNKDLAGVINASSPMVITNEELMSELANVYGKRIWLPNIPQWFVKLLFGEISTELLNGGNVVSQKLLNNGFVFNHNTINV
jgi:uncharacterized protein